MYLNDDNLTYEKAQTYFVEADLWAREHCSSYIDFHVQDVSDVSYTNDLIVQYRFADPKDAVWFQLKWK